MIVIPITKLKVFKAIRPDKMLLESIRDRGILTPVIVDKDYKIIDGKQRIQCALNLNMTQVPVTVVDMTLEQEREFKFMQPKKNIPATMADLGKAVIVLMKRNNYTLEQVAGKVDRSVSTIKRWIREANKHGN